jgi:hypothetical protein
MEVSDQVHTSAALPPWKELLACLGYEAGWASEPVWTLWSRWKSPVPTRDQTLTVQPVAHHYTN